MVPSLSIQGRMARTSQGTATRETGGQRQELRKKRFPLMTDGVKRTKNKQLNLRKMRHDCRESTFKRRKDKAESMMEPRQGRIRKGKEGIRPRELGSGNKELGQNSQEGGQGGGSSPERKVGLLLGPSRQPGSHSTWVCRPLALRVQGQSLGGNARNGQSAGCSVPNRGQGEGRTSAATAGSLTSKQLVLNG